MRSTKKTKSCQKGGEKKNGSRFIEKSKTMKQIQQAVFGIPEYEIKRSEGYRPRILNKQMARLRIKKVRTGKPITKLVAEALDNYLENIEGG